MQELLIKKFGEKHHKREMKDEKKNLIIDFTEGGNFKKFDESLKKYLRKHINKKKILIWDYIFPLVKLSKKKYLIKDHINLSGINPLIGADFISLTNIYSKNGVVVAGLKEGNSPNDKERKILVKSNVKAYCYNLIPTVIFAASLNYKINATGIVKNRWVT